MSKKSRRPGREEIKELKKKKTPAEEVASGTTGSRAETARQTHPFQL
ncbi:MAG: hypothetical protein GY792_06125 [Gammaproteobacteria bacterium]|nr:hypothetical protein [Gammaproteobacteria bacterium]